MNIAIIGCGLIGKKRAAALSQTPFTLYGCTDKDPNRSITLAKAHGITHFPSVNDLLHDDSIKAVIISTLHDSLADLSLSALQAGKHVLVEKPACRNVAELGPLQDFLSSSKLKYRVGLNHRFHPAILKAFELVESNIIGDLMFIRGRYGHGGRLNYDREWRSDFSISGGGELIDQGPHLIDLASCFLGPFSDVIGFTSTMFWDMSVDDNSFMTLRTKSGRVAFLHVSCTEWKNLFSFEIYGRGGKIEVSGLGGSYGPEKVTLYDMQPQMGPPPTYSWEFPMSDTSWSYEINEFFNDIQEDRDPRPGITEIIQTMSTIDRLYTNSDPFS